MTKHRRLLRVAVLVAVTLAAPFGIAAGVYECTLRDLGALPAPSRHPTLPRLVELGMWRDIGENADAFDVEPTWPWTPAWDFNRVLTHRLEHRPGALAANRVSGLWLGSKPRTAMARWHIRRAVLNVWLSRQWSAAALTHAMASKSYFGSGATGIHAAARVYFGKELENLSEGEVALLIGLMRAPTTVSPHRNPERALERRNSILATWQIEGLISAEVAAAESAKPLGIVAHGSSASSSPGTLPTRSRLPDAPAR